LEEQQVQIMGLLSTIMGIVAPGEQLATPTKKQTPKPTQKVGSAPIKRCGICGKPVEGKAGSNVCAFGGTHPICSVCNSPYPDKHNLVPVVDENNKQVYETVEYTNAKHETKTTRKAVKVVCPNTPVVPTIEAPIVDESASLLNDVLSE
jgi:hypothetical protein